MINYHILEKADIGTLGTVGTKGKLIHVQLPGPVNVRKSQRQRKGKIGS